MTHCPNCKIELVQVNDTKKECPKCKYSYSCSSTPTNFRTKVIDEVNAELRMQLVDARMGDGIAPWQRKWVIIPKRNYDTNRKYNGINRWLLAGDPEISYLTENSIKNRGLTLRPDAVSRMVITWVPPQLKASEKSLPPAEQRALLQKRFPRMLSHFVYRSKDVIDLPPKVYEEDQNNKRFSDIETFIKSTDALIEEGGNETYYSYDSDKIYIPRISQHSSSEEYYRNLMHELVHWTGAKTRLNRVKFSATPIEQGREELVAEMGAAYLCHYFNIPLNENSVAYINGWIDKIQADASLLSTSGQRAEKVLEFLKVN